MDDKILFQSEGRKSISLDASDLRDTDQGTSLPSEENISRSGDTLSVSLSNETGYTRWYRASVTNLAPDEYVLELLGNRISADQFIEALAGESLVICITVGGKSGEIEPARPRKFEVYFQEFSLADENSPHTVLSKIERNWIPRTKQADFSMQAEPYKRTIRPWRRVAYFSVLIKNASYSPVSVALATLPADQEIPELGVRQRFLEPIPPRTSEIFSCKIPVERERKTPLTMRMTADIQAHESGETIRWQAAAPLPIRIFPVPFLHIWKDWLAVCIGLLLLLFLFWNMFKPRPTHVMLKLDTNTINAQNSNETISLPIKLGETEKDSDPVILSRLEQGVDYRIQPGDFDNGKTRFSMDPFGYDGGKITLKDPSVIIREGKGGQTIDFVWTPPPPPPTNVLIKLDQNAINHLNTSDSINLTIVLNSTQTSPLVGLPSDFEVGETFPIPPGEFSSQGTVQLGVLTFNTGSGKLYLRNSLLIKQGEPQTIYLDWKANPKPPTPKPPTPKPPTPIPPTPKPPTPIPPTPIPAKPIPAKPIPAKPIPATFKIRSSDGTPFDYYLPKANPSIGKGQSSYSVTIPMGSKERSQSVKVYVSSMVNGKKIPAPYRSVTVNSGPKNLDVTVTPPLAAKVINWCEYIHLEPDLALLWLQAGAGKGFNLVLQPSGRADNRQFTIQAGFDCYCQIYEIHDDGEPQFQLCSNGTDMSHPHDNNKECPWLYKKGVPFTLTSAQNDTGTYHYVALAVRKVAFDKDVSADKFQKDWKTRGFSLAKIIINLKPQDWCITGVNPNKPAKSQ